MKQHKVLTYISISIITLCAVVLAGVFCVEKENAFARESAIIYNTLYEFDTNFYCEVFVLDSIADTYEWSNGGGRLNSGTDNFIFYSIYFVQLGRRQVQIEFRDNQGDAILTIDYYNASPASLTWDTAITPSNNDTFILYSAPDGEAGVDYSIEFWELCLSFLAQSATQAPQPITYSVTWNLTNGTGSPATVTAGTWNTLTLTPNTGYNLPNANDVTISGSFDSAIYNQQSGSITITNPTSNITVTATFPEIITSYSVIWNLTNGTGSPATVTVGTSTALTLTPNSGYTFPYRGDITVSGGYRDISYGINADNRVTTININRPSSNITVTATFPAATYLVTWNLTNGTGSPSTVTGGNTETTLTLTPNDGYAFPASITLTGTASYDYNPATGIIRVSSPRSDISIAANFQKTIASGTYFLPTIADLKEISAFSITTDNIYLYYNNNMYATLDGNETADFTQLHIDKIGKNSLGLYIVDVDTAPLGDNQYVIYLAANEYATSKYLYPLAYIYLSNNLTTGDAGAIAFFDNCYKVDNALAYYTVYESAYPLVYEAALQYNLGYSAGYTDAANENILGDNTASLIEQIFGSIFGNIFKIELFPGFPLYLFILIPAVFAVFGLILWLIRGK